MDAAQDRDLFEPMSGQIRSFADGGPEYVLRAFVRIVPAEGSVAQLPEEMGSEPVRVSQATDLQVRTSVDAETVLAGEGFVTHVVVENRGTMPARQP